MVGQGNGRHPVGHGFVNESIDGGLSVENGILRVYVQVHKWLHDVFLLVDCGVFSFCEDTHFFPFGRWFD